jgi:hypothetical protein
LEALTSARATISPDIEHLKAGAARRHAPCSSSCMGRTTTFGDWAVCNFAALLLATACTTLGPMPATTGMAMLPAQRPSLELQAGLVPGYYLSAAARSDPKGASMAQGAALFEPDRLLSLPGLAVGARYAGDKTSGPALEPMIGYRRTMDADRRFSLGAFGYGTHAHGTNRGASYSATRGGAEAGLDARLTPSSQWLEVHVMTALSLTGLNASGTYCLDDASAYGVDCPTPPSNVTNASAGGFYPGMSGALAFDFARHLHSAFHGGRLVADVATGTMPTVVGGNQKDAAVFVAGGLSLTLAFGARE